MPNSKNNAASSHADAAATVTPESGNNNIQGFNFRFPTFKEDVFIKHPSPKFLNDMEKEQFAFAFMRDIVFPGYDNLAEDEPAKKSFDAFEAFNKWIGKEEFNQIMWNMLQYSISSQLADCDSDFRSCAMESYRYLDTLSGFIFGKTADWKSRYQLVEMQ